MRERDPNGVWGIFGMFALKEASWREGKDEKDREEEWEINEKERKSYDKWRETEKLKRERDRNATLNLQ